MDNLKEMASCLNKKIDEVNNELKEVEGFHPIDKLDLGMIQDGDLFSLQLISSKHQCVSFALETFPL